MGPYLLIPFALPTVTVFMFEWANLAKPFRRNAKPDPTVPAPPIS